MPTSGKELVEEIEDAWDKPQPDWARKRILVVRLIAQHNHSAAQIMEIAGVSRQTVFTYRDKVMAEGVEGLLKRKWAGARTLAVRGADAMEFIAKLAMRRNGSPGAPGKSSPKVACACGCLTNTATACCR